MADNFGLKIGVEGEKEFKQALSDINRQFKVLGSEMNLVTSQFDKQDKSVEALAARNGVLSKEIEAQKGKIDTLKAALDNAASSFGETDKRTLAWQTQLNNAQAELNKMERELSENNRALDEAAKGFDDAEKQADEFGVGVEKSAKEADNAGGKFEKLGSIVKGVGAAMTTAFAAVGAATIAAAKALTDMTVGAAAYADEILTASTVTGMSTESLQAYKYAAELVDVPLETLTKSMAKNVKSMSTAQSGTGAMAEAYAKLGVAVTDSNGQLRDSETVYWEAIDALGNVANETERDAIAMQLFGKSAQELNPLIAQGSAGIAALTEEAKHMGAVMSDEQLADLGAFDDSIQRLKAGSAAAKNALGLLLLPQLQALATDGVSLLGDFTKGMLDAGGDWSKISEVIGNAVGGIADLLLSNLPKIVEAGIADLMEAGATVRTAFCGPCFGAGDVPSNKGLSIRHSTRNFPNREGSKVTNGQIASVALMDARSIAATAANKGYLTAATDIDADFTKPKYYFDHTIYDNRVFNGVGKADPSVEIKFGPNIVDWPKMHALTDNVLLKVVSMIHDPVTTTDELIPSGETSSYRSNPLGLAEFTLSRKDPAYVGKAKEVQKVEKARIAGQDIYAEDANLKDVYEAIEKQFDVKPEETEVGSVIFAVKPGDGSAREQAASCQRVLGGMANIAREYATKRYRSNLINWGMLPFVFDGDLVFDKDDYIFVKDIKKAIETKEDTIHAYVVNQGMKEIELHLGNLTDDEREIILKGCLINYNKKN